MDVGRHLGPLLGQCAGLALGDEVPGEAEPPGPEDDDGRRNHQCGTPHGPQGRHGGVSLDQQDDPAGGDEDTDENADDEPAAPPTVGGVAAQERDDVAVDEGLLRLVGVAPDEDHHADGKQGGPTDEAHECDVQGARDQLQRDEQREQDGDDQTDAAAVVDGPGVDVAVLPLHGDQQPGHGVDEHHDAAHDREEHEADAHPRDVDPGGPRDGSADATEYPVVRAPPEAAQPPGDVVVAVVVAMAQVRPRPAAVRPGPVAV